MISMWERIFYLNDKLSTLSGYNRSPYLYLAKEYILRWKFVAVTELTDIQKESNSVVILMKMKLYAHKLSVTPQTYITDLAP